MKNLLFSLLLIASTALAQSPAIVFPVDFEVNKAETGGNALFGGMFFEAALNGTKLDIIRRTVIFFKDLGGFERDDAFSTSELFLRESYFEHVIIKKRAVEEQFSVDFIKFAQVAGNRRCAQFVLTVKGDDAIRSLFACFDGDTYVIRRIQETLVVGTRSTNVTYDLTIGPSGQSLAAQKPAG